MRDVHFPNVKIDWDSYDSFVGALKVTSEEKIDVSSPSERVDCKGATDVNVIGFEKALFEVVVSTKRNLKYGLRILSLQFDEKPCLRFCSRGQTHMNPDDGSGIASRSVPTPHFHKVNSSGILIAYQTPDLVQSNTKDKITSNLQAGIDRFCQEINLSTQSGHPLRAVAGFLSFQNVDPLENASFPQ